MFKIIYSDMTKTSICVTLVKSNTSPENFTHEINFKPHKTSSMFKKPLALICNQK